MDRIAELERKLENLLRYAVVHEVNGIRCRVRSGALVSAWLRWIDGHAGGDRSWWPPQVGEQVLLLSPGGDLSNGVVITGLFSDAHPAPDDKHTRRRLQFADGTVIDYDTDTHRLRADVAGDVDLIVQGDLIADVAGEANLTAASAATVAAPSITLDGNVTINGNVDVQGVMTNNGKVVGAWLRVGGVTPGGGVSGLPV